MKKQTLSYNSFVVATLLVFSTLMIFPFFWMVTTSLKPGSEIFAYPPTILPQAFHFENYLEVFQAAPFHLFYWNSIVVAIATTFGQIATCAMGAFAFSRLQFPGRNLIFLLYLSTLMVPFQVTMIPVFSIVKFLGWIDTLEALIVPSIFSAYGTFLLRQFFMTIPKELDESIKMDGGGHWTCFLHIILPLSKVAIVTLGVFVFLYSWNNFLWPLLVVNTVAMKTLPLGITFFQGRYASQWNLVMVAATITMIPLLFVYLFAQRYFIAGITAGAVKG